jgi:GH24 family phage-related lysozyme (muramidase)
MARRNDKGQFISDPRVNLPDTMKDVAQTRDIQTGKMRSKYQSAVREARLSLDKHGKNRHEQEIVELEQLAKDDTDAVQSYINKLIELVRTSGETASELKRVLPLLKEIEQLVESDKSLTKAEQKRVQDRAKALQSFIQRKVSVFGRVDTVARKVGRKASGALRRSVDNYQGESNILNVGARTLSSAYGRYDRRKEHQKEVLEARADILQSRQDREESGEYGPKTKPKKAPKLKTGPKDTPLRTFDFDDDGTTKKKKIRHADDDSLGGDTQAILTNILDTDTSMLGELQKISKQILRDAEGREQNREEDARKAEQGRGKVNKHPHTEGIGKLQEAHKKDTPEGIFGGILSSLNPEKLLELVGLSKLGGSVFGLLKPAAELLGKSFLVAGAAVAGWELGKYLDDLSDHKLSGAVENFAKYVMRIPSDRVAAGLDKVNPQSNEQARLGGQPVSELDRLGLGVTPVDKKSVGQSVVKAPAMRRLLGGNRTLNDVTTWNGIGQLMPSLSPTKLPASQMEMSPEGLDLLKHGKKGSGYHGEGFSDTAYDDVGSPAVGYGMHTFDGKPVKMGQKVTQTAADAELLRQLREQVYPHIREDIHVPLTQSQFDSLASFYWNNPKGWKSLVKKINNRTITPADFQKSATVHGLPFQPLVARREVEGAPFADFAKATPSANRNAASVASLMALNSTAPTVITVTPPASGRSGGGGQIVTVPVIPQPIQTNNTESTLKAIQSIQGT